MIGHHERQRERAERQKTARRELDQRLPQPCRREQRHTRGCHTTRGHREARPVRATDRSRPDELVAAEPDHGGRGPVHRQNHRVLRDRQHQRHLPVSGGAEQARDRDDAGRANDEREDLPCLEPEQIRP
jgi:hypothetical protein